MSVLARAVRLAGALGLWVGGLGCAPSPAVAPPVASLPPAPARPPAAARPSAGGPLPGRPGVWVRVVSETSLPYRVSALGVAGHHVGISLQNTTHGYVELGELRVTFSARREGVPFPCRPLVGAAGGEREPSRLLPFEGHVFERDLDCQLTLPGRYTIGVQLTLGGGAPIALPELPIDVEPRGGRAPQQHPGVPGLWAMTAGDKNARPLSAEGFARGGYAVVIALVNGGPRPLPLRGARVLFRVTRVGTPLPCMDEPVSLKAPLALAPGESHFERIPVTCVMNKPGTYDIDSALVVDPDPRELPMGRTRVTVGADPNVIFPPRAY